VAPELNRTLDVPALVPWEKERSTIRRVSPFPPETTCSVTGVLEAPVTLIATDDGHPVSVELRLGPGVDLGDGDRWYKPRDHPHGA
jgi:hypothetical protein